MTSLNIPSGNSIHNYLEIMFPIDVLRFSEIRTMRNHLSEILMLNDIQITSDYMSRWARLPTISWLYVNHITSNA
jgi:hypothetical protein